MSENQDRQINYCFIDQENEFRTVFVIKWHKGNLYLMNAGWDCKISYHTPRQPSGKSKVHLKINKMTPLQTNSLCCPIEEIKGVKPMGGSGTNLRDIDKLPKPDKKAEVIKIDVRSIFRTYISAIQWQWFLVEPNKLDLLKKHPMITTHQKSEFSEPLGLHILDKYTPWVVTEFIRIRDENPIWYKDLPTKKDGAIK